MSDVTNAVVEQVSSKEVKTRYGMKKTHSFKAGGEWFSTGFKANGLGVGDTVSFAYTEDSYGKQVDPSSIKKAAGSVATLAVVPTPTGSKAASSGGYGSKGVFPIPALDGQRSIVRQNALTNARELLTSHVAFYDHDGDAIVRIEGGELSPAAKDFLNAMADLVIQTARKFEAYTAGDLDLEEVKAEMEATKKAA